MPDFSTPEFRNPRLKVITVFGGTGFIGRHMIYALARTGATIRVATRVPARAYFLRPAGAVGQIVPVACDIHDDASVANALKGASHAVNLLGVLFEKGRKSTFEKIHIAAAERIARACRAANLQMLVHISALGASVRDGASEYARSKGTGEDKVIHAFPRSVVLRPSIVFGADDSFFNQLARMGQMTGFVPLIAGGSARFQPVYVGDVAQAVSNIMSNPDGDRHYGQIYELGGPDTYTLRALVELMLRHSRLNASTLRLPAPLAKLIGACCAFMPRPVLTVDMVRQLTRDNVLERNAPGLALLGVTPTSLETVLPSYMAQYWPGGFFAQKRLAS